MKQSRIALSICIAAALAVGSAMALAQSAGEAAAATATELGLLRLLGAGLLGALLVKAREIGYQEIRRRSERR